MGREARVRNAIEFFRDSACFRMRSADLRRLEPCIRAAIIDDFPLSGLSYWGVGIRTEASNPEKDALTFLNDWLKRLTGSHGIRIKTQFIITDTHAVVNEIPPSIIERYCANVEELLLQYGYATVRMSKFLQRFNQSSGCESIFREQITSAEWDSLPGSWTRELERCAAFRAQRGHRAKEVARAYYSINVAEAAMITSMRAFDIFLSYQNPGLDFLLPGLPKIFAFVGPSRLVMRPWFNSEENRGHNNLSD